jgi:hypothetical protein
MKVHSSVVVLAALAAFVGVVGRVLTAQVQPAPTIGSVPKVVSFTGAFHPASGLPPARIEGATFS